MPIPARDNALREIILALIAVRLPSPVMTPPKKNRLRALPGGPFIPDRTVRYAVASPSVPPASSFFRTRCRQTKTSRPHPPMSVTQNLVSGCAREKPAATSKIHKQSAWAMPNANAATARVAGRAAKPRGQHPRVVSQLVDESLGFSTGKFPVAVNPL
jgi:hypothetical protein